MDLSLNGIPDGQFAACQALVYSLLQRSEAEEREGGYALALVSAHPSAGVTHVRQIIELMLNENEANCAKSVDCDLLGLPDTESPDLMNRGKNARRQKRQRGLMRSKGLARYRDRIGHLNRLREAYSYVLLDCHSLAERTDVLGLAPVVDGTIVIVECNRTTTGQLDDLERSIEKYGGTILGSVLNKNSSSVPNWMNSVMERIGI
jgi:hypothetical protein